MYFKNISRVVLRNALERQATACQESIFFLSDREHNISHVYRKQLIYTYTYIYIYTLLYKAF